MRLQRRDLLHHDFRQLLTLAGVAPWPKLFQIPRASRETELALQHPIHIVTAWMGNTPKVAQRHDLQVTDADFERTADPGAGLGAAGMQNWVQPVSTHNAPQHDKLDAIQAGINT